MFNEKPSLCKKATKTAMKIVFLVMVAITVFVLFQFFFPETSFEIFGFRFYLISYTGSMEPQLNFNDLIVVKKFDFNSLEKGDIITYIGLNEEGEEIAITHEIVDIYQQTDTGKKYLMTKGINLPYPDAAPVTDDGVDDTNLYVGKFGGKSEFLGNVFAYFSSGYGAVMVVVNILGIVAIEIILEKSQNKKLLRPI